MSLDSEFDSVALSDKLTVVILTMNEERNIRECLADLPPTLKTVVVDSGSSDKTVHIAEGMGARIYRRSWSGFADQRNFALAECEIDTDWILFVDADERYTQEFFRWAAAMMQSSASVDVYDVPSALFLDGKRLRFAPGYPIYHPRLVRKGRAEFRVNHAGHGELAVAQRSSRAPYGYDHFFQAGSLKPWLQKHISLAELEASGELTQARTLRGRISAIFGRSIVRPPLRFIYHYLVRGGIFDGKNGLRYSLMYTWYELSIWLLKKEFRGE